MTNNLETPTPNVSPDAKTPFKTAGGKYGNSSNGFAKHLNIIIPSIAVFLCAVVVFCLLQGEIKYANSVHGRFVCGSYQDAEAYMIFDRDGSYDFYADDESIPRSGSWEMNADKIFLTESSSGNSDMMYFIDSKYIAFDDENFLEGRVPDESSFDAQFTADDGTVYVFESDGKCYTSEDGRNTELGGYMTDGNFIVITIEDTAHTYLNCGEGITPVFFTQE